MVLFFGTVQPSCYCLGHHHYLYTDWHRGFPTFVMAILPQNDLPTVNQRSKKHNELTSATFHQVCCWPWLISPGMRRPLRHWSCLKEPQESWLVAWLAGMCIKKHVMSIKLLYCEWSPPSLAVSLTFFWSPFSHFIRHSIGHVFSHSSTGSVWNTEFVISLYITDNIW